MELHSINSGRELYNLKSEQGTTCLGFDNAQDRLERVVTECVGRGLLTPGQANFTIRETRIHRGSSLVIRALNLHLEALKSACEAAGDRAVYGLSPQLVGLEGHRVQVEGMHGDRRRFIVGKSTGWAPCHLEIARRNSNGGVAASREYLSVVDLGVIYPTP